MKFYDFTTLDEICKFLDISAQEMLKKNQKSQSKNRTWSVVFAVHHLHHYAAEDLLTSIGWIGSYIATALTINTS